MVKCGCGIPSGTADAPLLIHAVRIPTYLRTGDVLARGVADEEDFGGVEAQHFEHAAINLRVGFAQSDLGGNYHRLEQLCDAGIGEDLATALRVIEVRQQSEAIMRRDLAHRRDPFGRRPGDAADAVHVDARELLGERSRSRRRVRARAVEACGRSARRR